jgi:catechol 2,3-dioxygenase-like lactoylglutathione lyase family enzyme
VIIENITLLTSNLHETKDFYTKILELKLINENSNEFTVEVGLTDLTFKQTDKRSNPYYHFAIDIPENKMDEVKIWTKYRAKLNTEEGQDEVSFKTWNAHSIYFEDPSGNIVEFIARHNLNNGIEHKFSSEELLSISEIGIVVEEVIPFVRTLNKIGIPNWREDSDGLTPVGNEEGLFIVVKNGRRWFFSERYAEFYPVIVSIKGVGNLGFTVEDNQVFIKKNDLDNPKRGGIYCR